MILMKINKWYCNYFLLKVPALVKTLTQHVELSTVCMARKQTTRGVFIV